MIEFFRLVNAGGSDEKVYRK